MRALSSGRLRRGRLQILQNVLTLLSCGLYVYETYLDEDTQGHSGAGGEGDGLPVWVQVAEVCFAVVFLVDYVASVVVADQRCLYVVSPTALVDFLSIVPVATLLFDATEAQLGFLRFLRVFKSVRILRLHRILKPRMTHGTNTEAEENVSRRALSLLMSLSGIVFVSTGIVFAMQQASDQEAFVTSNPDPDSVMRFHDALYYFVITFTTVGYGDVAPALWYSRLVVVVLVLITFSVLPYQVGQLADALARRSAYRGFFRPSERPGHRHVVVTGSVSASNLSAFLAEMFHADHGEEQVELLKVVVLSPYEPTEGLLSLMRGVRYRQKLVYLRGSALNDEDLKRCHASRAHAVFLLANNLAPNEEAEDAALTLKTIAVKKFVPPDVRVVVQLMRPASKLNVNSVGVSLVVCQDELRLSLMAQSCLCPGFSTMIVNLVRSHSKPPVESTPVAPELSSERLADTAMQASRHSSGGMYDELRAMDAGAARSEQKAAVGSSSPPGHATIKSDKAPGSTRSMGSGRVAHKVHPNISAAHSARQLYSSIGKADVGAWYEEYYTGASHEIYRARMPRCFAGMTFARAAALAFDRLHVVLVGLSISKVVTDAMTKLRAPRVDSTRSTADVLRTWTDEMSTSPTHRSTRVSNAAVPQQLGARVLINPNADYVLLGGEEVFLLAQNSDLVDDLHELDMVDPEASVTGLTQRLHTDIAPLGPPSHSFMASERQRRPSAATTLLDEEFAVGHLREAQELVGRATEQAVAVFADASSVPGGISTADSMVGRQDVLRAVSRARGLLAKAEVALSELGASDQPQKALRGVASDYLVPGDMCKHIVLLGSIDAAEHFVLPLRAKSATPQSDMPIVVVHPSVKSFEALLGRLEVEHRTNIFLVHGSPEVRANLDKAHVTDAHAVAVISSAARQGADAEVPSEAIGLADRNALVAFVELEDHLPPERVHTVVELMHEANFRFMRQSNHGSATLDSYLSPAFAAGRVFSPAMLDTLMVQTFYNPDELELLTSLLQPESTAGTGPAPTWKRLGAHLVQRELPPHFVGRTYEELFVWLATAHGDIALGLYRPRNTLSSPMPYVCTNPNKGTVLVPGDRIFVMSHAPAAARARAGSRESRSNSTETEVKPLES